ncbi:MAG: MerR family transcriptional regulator [Pseudomonadota bacterium]
MNKSADAFRTISEVADDLDLPQHVLRFWETKFSQIKPMKRGGGRRYYRPDDIDLLKGIRHLLYSEGYTIKGVQRILKERGNRFVMAIGTGQSTADFDPVPEPGLPPQPQAGFAEAAPETIPEAVQEPAQSGGVLGRLLGDRRASGEPAAPVISNEQRDRLQATLMELLECKRLLDQVR